MKQRLASIKSHSPVVKKKSHDLLKFQFDQLDKENQDNRQTAIELQSRNDDWAREVRNLRLEVQRLKEYEKWLAIYYPNSEIINRQRELSSDFEYRPLISIILPVYNTDPDYLRVCIESVLAQSYPNWELCITDDCSSSQATIDVVNWYKNKEPRIKLKRADKNGHISIASNQAISLASGEYIALLDHDDFLWPNALFEMVSLLQTHPDADLIYSDEDKIDADSDKFIHFSPYFKPDWSPHLLECINYITHFTIIRTELVRTAGGFDRHLIGAQDWDLFLRISEKTDKIYHVPTILYSWRAHNGSTAKNIGAKTYALKNQKNVLLNHFKRTSKLTVKIDLAPNTNFWYPKFSIIDSPLVSIIIPTKDKKDYLAKCLGSVIDKTTYENYEIVIVDTGSREIITKEYYAHLLLNFKNKIVIKYWRHQPFNYSDACNFGARHAKGKYLVMLNNDTEVITNSWLQDMLGYAQQASIGAVGVKLFYPSKQIQHAGVTIGIGSEKPVAGHSAIQIDFNSYDFLTNMYGNAIRDVSAVTAACLMISTKKFWEVNGFDPIFRVTFNDVDLNLKLLEQGYNNIYLPFVELYHHESVSVGRVFKNRDMHELNDSAKLMRQRWKKIIDHDKYHNKNFYKLSSNFGLNIYDDQVDKRKNI